MVNCLTIDLEGFIESNLESIKTIKEYDKKRENYEIERNADFILSFLSQHKIKATFLYR